MATAAVSTAVHQLPTMSVPRVRPPRMLKGTPSPNTNPQPDGPVPLGKVWVQGRWRDPSSNAAKHLKEVQTRQVERATHSETRGMNIYAYNHMRTNQVVYSLTRNLENTKVLRQLVYHGKKTVPAALRRDVWRPYFSVHFAQNPAGAQAGLLAYQRLRELTLQRQLSPPAELITTTQKDIDDIKLRSGDPVLVQVKLKEEKHNRKGDQRLKIPALGQIMPKKMRARKLMDQRASSVADVAFVLQLATQGKSFQDRLEAQAEERQKRYLRKGPNGRRQMNRLRRKVEVKQSLISERLSSLPNLRVEEGKMPLDKHAVHRLTMENPEPMEDVEEQRLELVERMEAEVAKRQQKAIDSAEQTNQDESGGKQELSPGKRQEILQKAREEYLEEQARHPSSAVAQLQQIDEATQEIKVLWADLRDGTYAESWPDNVYHAELAPRAISTRDEMRIRQHSFVDEDGEVIEEQKVLTKIYAGSSVHVMSTEKPEGWTPVPQQLELQAKDLKQRMATPEYQKRVRHTEFMSTFSARAWKTALQKQIRETARDRHNQLQKYEQITAEVIEIRERLEAGEDGNREPDLRGQILQLQRQQEAILDNVVEAIARQEILETQLLEERMEERAPAAVGEQAALIGQDAIPVTANDVVSRAMKAAKRPKTQTRQQIVSAEAREQLRELQESRVSKEFLARPDMSAIRTSLEDRLLAARQSQEEFKASIPELRAQVRKDAVRDSKSAFEEQEAEREGDDAEEETRSEPTALGNQWPEDSKFARSESGAQGQKQDIVEPPKSLWGRVKGLFGR